MEQHLQLQATRKPVLKIQKFDQWYLIRPKKTNKVKDALPDLTKKINISIIYCEVVEDSSCAPVDPQIVEEFLCEQVVFILGLSKVNCETTTSI